MTTAATKTPTEEDRAALLREALKGVPFLRDESIPGIVREEYHLAGLPWQASLHSLGLIHYREREGLEVGVAQCGHGFAWKWWRQLYEGGDESVYLRHSGHGDTLAGACAAASAFKPEERLCEVAGHAIVWYQRHRGWMTALEGGDEAEVFELEQDYFDEGRFLWRRRYAAGGEVMKFISEGRLTGKAHTLELAMQAAVAAQENFLRACGALVARRAAGSQP